MEVAVCIGSLEELLLLVSFEPQTAPEDRPGRAYWLRNFGNRLSSWYDRTRNLQDLEASIVYTIRGGSAGNTRKSP